MRDIFEYAIRGLLSGTIYGILAMPMSLAFVTVRSIDFSVGAYALVAAAIAGSVGGLFGVVLGISCAALGGALMGALFLAASARTSDHIVPALVSFGLSVAIGSLVLWSYGTRAFVLSAFPDFWSFAGIRVSPQGVVNLLIGLLIVVSLNWLLHRTDLGRMMRAVAVNPKGAELSGIAVTSIQFGTYLVGGLLGGCAGVLILYGAGLDFSAPLGLMMSGFGAAVIFGLGDPTRAFLGGVTMGIAEALAAGYTSGPVTAMVPFLFILVILATGRFGVATLGSERP
jgi:branched-subunit amino acid ABC-type transport system permease component